MGKGTEAGIQGPREPGVSLTDAAVVLEGNRS